MLQTSPQLTVSTVTTGVSETIGEAVLQAQVGLDELSEVEGLRAAARRLADEIGRGRWRQVMPVGQAASRLLGAALLIADPPPHTMHRLTAGLDHVLIVEAVAISGLEVDRAIRAARSQGIERIGVFVWREETVSGRRRLSPAGTACLTPTRP